MSKFDIKAWQDKHGIKGNFFDTKHLDNKKKATKEVKKNKTKKVVK